MTGIRDEKLTLTIHKCTDGKMRNDKRLKISDLATWWKSCCVLTENSGILSNQNRVRMEIVLIKSALTWGLLIYWDGWSNLVHTKAERTNLLSVDSPEDKKKIPLTPRRARLLSMTCQGQLTFRQIHFWKFFKSAAKESRALAAKARL